MSHVMWEHGAASRPRETSLPHDLSPKREHPRTRATKITVYQLTPSASAESTLLESFHSLWKSLESVFPPSWQGRHSRTTCQIYCWARNTDVARTELYLNTPAIYFTEQQNMGVFLEECLHQMRETPANGNVDLTKKHSYLVKRYKEEEMKLSSPVDVFFKPFRMVRRNYRISSTIKKPSIIKPTISDFLIDFFKVFTGR
jgi:hypothetical protein